MSIINFANLSHFRRNPDEFLHSYTTVYAAPHTGNKKVETVNFLRRNGFDEVKDAKIGREGKGSFF